MPTVLDDKIKATIAQHGAIKTVLSVLFAVLTFGRGRGWFQRDAGPKA